MEVNIWNTIISVLRGNIFGSVESSNEAAVLKTKFAVTQKLTSVYKQKQDKSKLPTIKKKTLFKRRYSVVATTHQFGWSF